MAQEGCILLFLALSGVWLLILLLRHRVVVRGLLLSAVSGIFSLGCVSLLSAVIPLGVGFNLYTLLTALIYGLPGVLGMVLLQLFWG